MSNTVSRQLVTEILDEVFDENLMDFVGRKALVNLRNTILDRMEEAGMVQAAGDEIDFEEEDSQDDYDYEDDYDYDADEELEFDENES